MLATSFSSFFLVMTTQNLEAFVFFKGVYEN